MEWGGKWSGGGISRRCSLLEEVGRDKVLERVDALIDRSELEAVCGEIYEAPGGGRMISCGF